MTPQQHISHTLDVDTTNDNHSPVAVQALQTLYESMQRIPADTPLAGQDHRLANFAGDPQACVDPELDDWADILSPMFKRSFGWGVEENRENVMGMLQRGEYGLDGFLRFLRYFVNHRGLAVAMFESKVEMLVEELNKKCVRWSSRSTFETYGTL
jgi:hypothetical protein